MTREILRLSSDATIINRGVRMGPREVRGDKFYGEMERGIGGGNLTRKIGLQVTRCARETTKVGVSYSSHDK